MLVAGGYDGWNYQDSTEIYDPETRTFERGPVMRYPRAYATCTTLDDGSILIAGGTSRGYGSLPSAELVTIIDDEAAKRGFHIGGLAFGSAGLRCAFAGTRCRWVSWQR